MGTIKYLMILAVSVSYLLLIFQALRKNQSEDEKASFSSFFLWSILDLIMWANTIRAKNDPTLIGTYTVWTVIFTLLLLFKKQYKWTKTDSIVAVITATCFVISQVVSPVWAVFAGALSITLAGIPNLIMINKSPVNKMLIATIFFFILAPCLNIIDIYFKQGILKDYIYPVIGLSYWILAFILNQINNRKRRFRY